MSGSYEQFGKYILLEKMNSGGMAEVFLARGSQAGGNIVKFVAVKRILPHFSDKKEFIEMFKNEAKVAVNLTHNNIVSIYEFGVEAGQFFIVMDYVNGRNIRQILGKLSAEKSRFRTDQIVYICREVAAGLDHAHRCIDGTTGKPLNITHRDISPQNVMINFEGEIKVIDFGIAKAETEMEQTKTGTLKGKFGYMSPEQIIDGTVDPRSDIFSLGVMMWELFSNKRLFSGNSEMDVLQKIKDCKIPKLTLLNSEIHPELERICMKALSKDPNMRYQNCAALQKDLNKFLNFHYPEFSSQDFSIFVKSLFTDDLLAFNNKLVEYAKIQMAPEVSTRTARLKVADINDETYVVNRSSEGTQIMAVTADQRQTAAGQNQQAANGQNSAQYKNAVGQTVGQTQVATQMAAAPDVNPWENSGLQGSGHVQNSLKLQKRKKKKKVSKTKQPVLNLVPGFDPKHLNKDIQAPLTPSSTVSRTFKRPKEKNVFLLDKAYWIGIAIFLLGMLLLVLRR